VSSLYRHNITDEQRLEIYDRLASKWAEKMETHLARRQVLLRHPNLVVSFKNSRVAS